MMKNTVNRISPELIIVVDSLASRSIERIATIIQIADTGYHQDLKLEQLQRNKSGKHRSTCNCYRYTNSCTCYLNSCRCHQEVPKKIQV